MGDKVGLHLRVRQRGPYGERLSRGRKEGTRPGGTPYLCGLDEFLAGEESVATKEPEKVGDAEAAADDEK